MPINDNFGVTDEMIADREPSDYFTLAPKNQELVFGADGVFLSNDRQNLRSATADFRDPAIVTGSMIRLTFPSTGTGYNGRPTPRPKTKQFAVQIPSPLDGDPTKLLLRRQGLGINEGEPPGPIGGATGIAFVALTVQPQVRQAARIIAIRYKLDSGGQSDPSDEFVNATITLALLNLYKAQCRMMGDRVNDDFAAKAAAYAEELKAIYANLDARNDIDPEVSGLVIGIIPGRLRHRRYRYGSEC